MGLVSVTEYSRITGKDPGTIRKLLIAGRLQGIKIGNQWAIDDNEKLPPDRRVTSGDYRNWRKYSKLNHNPALSSAVKSIVKYIKKDFDEYLDSIVLYGSYARGDQTDESDVDIAVKLMPGYSRESYGKLLNFVSEKELECGKVLSVIDIDNSKYNEWKKVIPFYMNLESEGIVLWQA